LSERVRLEISGTTAELIFDRPGAGANTFDSVAIPELEHLLDQLESRRALTGVVVRSARPGIFLAGADLGELGALESPGQAEHWSGRAQRALRRLAALPMPTVAALSGAALGGGLEVALACRYRVASDDAATQLGLPEVQLGLCPAAGGTWRLPRQVGFRGGLQMLLSGRRVSGREARRIGLVDEVVPAAALAAACRRHLVERPRPKRGGGLLERALFALPPLRWWAAGRARAAVRHRTGERLPAPFVILRAAAAGPVRGGRSAEAIERGEFGRLAMTRASRRLVELFEATRAARPGGREARTLEVGVLGAGLMGGGIALVAARAGHRVRLHDVRIDALGRALASAAAHFAAARRKGRWDRGRERTALWRLRPAPSPQGFAACELIVEAVAEDLEVKRRVLSLVAAQLDERAIIASNTSTLPIAGLAEGLPRPERVLGLHFFSPVPKMPLVEIVRHRGTADEAVERSRSFVASLGKTSIVVGDGPGFYTSRVVGAMTGEAVRMVAEGSSIAEVESAGRRAGFPVGPLTLLDEVGLDVAVHAAATLSAAFPSRFAEPTPLAALVASGRLGRKNGRGFFDWRRGKRVDGEVEIQLRGSASALRVRGQDPAERLLLALVVEAVRCLEEGILTTPVDGDLGAVLGLGFPPEHGGPFRWIDEGGSAAVAGKLEQLAESAGAMFRPPAHLVDMARSGRRFHGSSR